MAEIADGASHLYWWLKPGHTMRNSSSSEPEQQPSDTLVSVTTDRRLGEYSTCIGAQPGHTKRSSNSTEQ